MNRALYRHVFNEKRGQVMAVAESAVGDGKGTGAAVGRHGAGTGTARWARLRRLGFCLLVAFGGAAVLPAAAQVVAYKAAPAAQQATILSAGNGVPLINIQTPSAAGVSHNTYGQFDVGAAGAILNNARTNVATQLGGWVQGNPWLARGTARVILNEVVSSTPSLLGGYIEVAGDRAQVVVANPAGVTCAGCGFLNAHRATLTTGTPLLSAGTLDGYRVEGGTLRIDGAGLDARGADYTDLIARAVELNAGVWAQALRVTTGANRVDAAHTQAVPISGAGPAPAFALDVAPLGGMYAGKIVLVGTEAGVGVRNAGTLAAAAGEVLVTAEGQLINRGTVVSGESSLTVATRGLDNTGTLASDGNLTVASRGDIDNSGLLHAGRELVLATDGQLANRQGTLDGQRLDLTAGVFRNDGSVRQSGTQALALTAAHLDNAVAGVIGHLTPAAEAGGASGGAGSGSGTGTETGALTGAPTASTAGGTLAVDTAVPLPLADGRIAVGTLANTGTLVASGTFALTTTGTLANAGTLPLDRLTATGTAFRNSGTVTATDAALAAATLDNRGGALSVSGRLAVAAYDLLNVRGTFDYAGADALTLTLAGRFDNTEGRFASNGHGLSLTADTVDNTGGVLTLAGDGALTLASGQLINAAGTIRGQGAVTVHAGTVNNAAGTLGAQGALVVTAAGLDNTGGRITSEQGGTLTVAGTLDNQGGTLASGQALTIQSATLDNRAGGRIVANDALAVTTTTGTLDNAGGTLSAKQALTVTAQGDVANAAGQLVAGTDLTLRTEGALDNTAGTVGAVAGQLSLSAGGAVTNAGGRLEAATDLTLSGQGLGNAGGTVLGKTLTVDTHGQALDNTQGVLAAETTLTLDSGALTNTAGLIQAGGALTVDTHGQTLTNRDTLGDGTGILGQSTVTLTVGALDNAAGRISAGDALALTAAGRFNNTGGTLASAAVLTLAAGDIENRAGGQIVADDALALTTTAGGLDNASGTLSAKQALTVDAAGALTNTAGTLVGGTDLTLNTNGALDNTDGTLGAVAGQLTLNAGGLLTNAGGRLEAAHAVVLASRGLANAGGTVFGQTLDLDTQGQALDNAQGQLVADRTLHIDSGALDNTGGLIQAGDALTLDTHGQALTNRDTLGDGRGLRGQGTVTLTAGTLDNATGRISAGGALTLTAAALDNAGGQAVGSSAGTVAVTGALDNQGGMLATEGALAVAAGRLDNGNGGRIVANDTLDVTTTTGRLANAGGTLSAKQALTVGAAGALDNNAGVMVGGTDLTLNAGGALDNRGGTLGAVEGGLTLSAGGSLANAGGRIEAATDLVLASQGLGNAGGTVFGQTLDIDTHGKALNNAQGQLVADRTLHIDSGALDNTGGLIQAGDALTLDTHGQTLTNAQSGEHGGLFGQATVTLRTGDLDNTAGVLGAKGALAITAAGLANTDGRLTSEDTLRIEAGALDNQGGTLASGKALDVRSATLDNSHQGQIVANDALTVRVTTGVLSNAGGTLSSQTTLTVTAADDITNATGRIVAGTDLALTTGGALDNTGGTLGAVAGRLDLSAGGLLTNTGGRLEAATDLVLDGQGLGNAGGTVFGKTLTVDTHEQALDNTHGTLAAETTLQVDSGALTNTGGLIQAGGALALNTHGQALINRDTLGDGLGIRGQDTITLTAGALDNAAGLVSAGKALALTAATLDNRNGHLVGSGPGTLTVTGTLDNRGGTLATEGALAVTTGRLDNGNGGRIVANDTLNVTTTTGTLDNAGGTLSAKQALAVGAAGALNNSAGVMVGGTDLTLNAGGALDNTGGTLAAVAGRLDVTATGHIDSAAGRLEAATDLLLDGQGLGNAGGTVLGKTLTVDTHGQALDNTQGVLAAETTLAINSGALTNTGGLIQAGGVLALNTHGQALINRDTLGDGTGIRGQDTVTLTAGALDNAAGLISAGDALALTAGTVDNRSGRLVAQAGMLLDAFTSLDNRSGDIQTAGDLTAHAADAIDNRGGLLRAGGTLSLVTQDLDNADTYRENKGIEADTVDLAVRFLDNHGGALRADTALTVRSTGTLDNTGGLISSQGTLALLDDSATRTLAVTNTGGTLLAGSALTLRAQRLSGDGNVLSHGDLALELVADLLNTGEIAAARDLHLTTAGTVTNRGTVQAGEALALQAAALDNAATGTLAGGAVDVRVTGTLTNRGLIDGGETFITAGTLDNLGTGRLYGDHLAIAAGTLNNLAEGGTAPVIAARDRLDLGVGTLANRDGALIFSASDMAIGGGLDTGHHATGQATAIDNASATLEALGHLAIDTASLTNRKTALATATVPDTAPLTGAAPLDYAPGLQFHWPIKKSSAAIWRDYVRDRYLNILVKLLGGGPDAALVALYNPAPADPDAPAPDPDVPPVTASVRDDFVNVWGDLAGYAGLVGGGLDAATRARLVAAVNAQDPQTLADSRRIWQILLDTLAAERPAALGQLTAALAAQGVASTAYWQTCRDIYDDCSYIDNTSATTTATRDVVTVDSPSAVIRAGGGMAIAATTLENRYSLIQAGGDMVLTGATLTNVGAELYRVTKTEGFTQDWHWVNNAKDSWVFSYDTQTLIGGVPGQIVAGGTLTGSFTGRIDNVTVRQNAAPVVGTTGRTPGTAGAGGVGTAAVGAGAAQTAAGSGGSATQTATAGTADTDAGAGASVGAVAQTVSAATGSGTGVSLAATAQTASATTASVPGASVGAVAQTASAATGGTSGGTARVTQVTAASSASGPSAVIATAEPTLALPANRLYHTNPNNTGGYLVETDPQFANYRSWLSSDYLLQALGLDPALTQKRLGDGFYEQRLITEQIAQLTGRRFLAGYANDEEQYRALMAAGLSVAQAWNLIPGVALSEAQMAQLTTDIVWLVEQTVTLADGSTQRVLVPQVYARVRGNDLAPTGALIAAENVQLQTTGDLATSGTIAGRQTVVLTAENIAVQRGAVAGRDVALQAATDLTVRGGTVEAERTLIATAGRDLTVAASTVDSTYAPRDGAAAHAAMQTTLIDRVAGLYVTGEGGTLVAAAGRDLSLLAAAVANAASADSGGATLLSAGRDLTLGTVTETSAASTSSKGNRWRQDTRTEVGSTLAAAGDLTLAAGNDLTARAASVVAGGALAASAGHDLTITTGEATLSSEAWSKSSTSGLLAKRSKERLDTLDETTAISSTFSGNTVALAAGNDLTVKGSSVTATHDLAATAGRDLILDTAQDTSRETHFYKEKSSGLSASSSGGISVGKSALKQNADVDTVTQVTSTLSGENVTLVSGRDTVIRAAGVLADNDLTVLAGRNIDLLAAANTQDVETHTQSSSNSIGLTPNAYGRWTLYGKNAGSQDADEHVVSQSTSLLSANTGDLTLRAGLDSQYKGTGQGNLLTQGADLLAGDALTLSGNAVALLPATDETSSHSLTKSKSFTVGARLAGPIGEIIDTLGQMAERATHTDNDRLEGALALKAGYDAWKLYENGSKLASDATQAASDNVVSNSGGAVVGADAQVSPGIGVQVYVGSSKSKSESSSHTATVTGTNLQAKTINITATETDLTLVGAKLQAEDIALSAQRDILLAAAANTGELANKSSGSSAGFGVTVAFGGQQNGLSFQINASQMKGTANGSETVYDNTLITASDSLSVKSGRDTTLKGAQLAGESVLLDVGGNLLIETLQDSSVYHSKQTSSGFNLSICWFFCAGTPVTGSVSASKQEIKHNYLSAVGQSGIAAGDGGFDITVKGHTELVGAAITSTAETEKNQLTTASLTSRDLENAQTTKSSSSSVSLSYNGGSALSTLASNTTSNLLANLNGNAALPKNESEHSQTQSVISPANVTITGSGNAEQDKQSQATADELMARDPATANGSLTNSLSLQQAQVLEQKIQKQKENQEAGQLVGAVLSGLVGDYAQKQAIELRAQGKNEEARQWEDGSAMKIALHGLAGAIAAKVGDGSLATGALAGMTQEALAPIVSKYLIDQGILPGSAEYTSLMQLGVTLAGTAVGAATGGTQGAATGASTAYVGVTNNYLDHKRPSLLELSEKERYENAVAACETGNRTACGTRDELAALSTERDAALRTACSSGISTQCNDKIKEAVAMGNVIYSINTSNGTYLYANSPESGTIRLLNTATIGTPLRPDSFQDQVSQSTTEGLILTGNVLGGSAAIGAGLASKGVAGAELGGMFYILGQMSRGEEIRYGELAVNMATSAAAAPLATTKVLLNAALGGTVAATNTATTNWIYGENQDVLNAGVSGVIFTGLGTTIGKGAKNFSAYLMPDYIGGKPFNPAIPILLQKVGTPNPYPGYAGFWVDQSVSNIPSFLPSNTRDDK